MLVADNVDLSHCGRSDKPSGQGLVFLQSDGAVSSVVVRGSNHEWPKGASYLELVKGVDAVLLQCEVPAHVNEAVAQAACAVCPPIPVFQDLGGEDRPISDEQLQRITFLCPNETELARLTGMRTSTEEETVAAAKSLLARGAKNVLVTLGAAGSILVLRGQGGSATVLRQQCCPLEGKAVVDETGAGDSFRAAFAVAMAEGRPVHTCLQFAAAAGAIAVSRMGAVPSLPKRDECEALRISAFGGQADPTPSGAHSSQETLAPPGGDSCFPLLFGSRLNSMKDRLDLWDGANSPLGWVARQGKVKGLDLVDFNFPQHLDKLSVNEVRQALALAKLKAGCVCMRYPKEMQAGAFTNPDPALRRRAIELTKEAGNWARQLGASELVIWSAYCGYDYHLQANYYTLWDRVKDAFQEVCDACPDIKVSLEFKPTDENTRFFAVPTTGAALLLVQEVDRPNMGLTLDFGHLLMAGENPAQSVAMVGRAGKLFGIQLNDGYGRGEDGLMFGSVHRNMALELVLWLQKTDFKGHIYFDTFPRNEDPVREAEYNIRRFKAVWAAASQLRLEGIEDVMARQDALGALELLEKLGL